MWQILFFMMTAILLSILLNSYNVTTTPKFIKFTLEYADTLDVAYSASFQATFNTASGPQTLGYAIMSPVGTTGSNTTWFIIPVGYVFDHCDFLGYGEYHE